MPFREPIVLLFMLFLSGSAFALDPHTGPVIEANGPVFDVPGGSWNLDKDTYYKVSMDVSATAETTTALNRHIESAARFLNMHARNGIDPGNIAFAIVVHGPAGKDLLKDAAYESRYMTPNPNTALLKSLHDAGVKVYLCGQTAAFRGFSADEINPSVTIAVSAMTAHVRLQSEGYTLIPF